MASAQPRRLTQQRRIDRGEVGHNQGQDSPTTTTNLPDQSGRGRFFVPETGQAEGMWMTTAVDVREVAKKMAAEAPRLSTGRIEQLRALIRR